MTSLEMRLAVDSTSAGGPMLKRQVREPVLLGWMLVRLGTSTACAPPPDVVARAQRPSEQTTAGTPVVLGAPPGAAIAELRRLSGLTWCQLARLIGVSRRALHFWASGKPMAPSNEEHLQRLLAVVRKADRGSASANRTAILSAHDDGSLPFDLLAAGEYDRVTALLGSGEARGPRPTQLSGEALAARAPRPPEELVGALQDRIHPASGRLLATKAAGIPRRK